MKQILPFSNSSHLELRNIQKYKKHSFVTKDNKEIFDAQSGNGAFPFGFDCKEIIEYVSQELINCPFVRANNYTTSDAVLKLNSEFERLSDKKFTHVFYGLSGSDAIETAIKMAVSYWKAKRQSSKIKILSFLHGYHGSSFVSSSATGMKAFHKPFSKILPFPWTIHINQPRWHGIKTEDEIKILEDQSLIELEETIKKEGAETIAAIIKEPFSWQSGVHPPSKEYFKKLRALCDKNEILLILDDIATGGGKLGSYFGFKWTEIDWDISCNAKAITGGYFPLSATLCNEKVGEVLYDSNFIHGWTFCPSIAGVLSALKTIEIFEKTNIISRSSQIEERIKLNAKKLLASNTIEGYRAVGVFGGLDIKKETASKKIEEELWNNGVQITCYRFDPIFRIILPLTISDKEIDILFDKLGKTLNEF